jgi:clan AA aspartic protease
MTSYFLNLTPLLEIVVRNPIMDKTFPADGRVAAVIDTGFEGFLLVPEDVFEKLSLNQLAVDKRELTLPNGRRVYSTGTYCEVVIPDLDVRLDGFVETLERVREVVAGADLLQNLKLTLNYCLRIVEVEACR